MPPGAYTGPDIEEHARDFIENPKDVASVRGVIQQRMNKMEISKYHNLDIEVFSDEMYTPDSADNLRKYDAEYYDNDLGYKDLYGPKIGVIVKEGEKTLKSAIIINNQIGVKSVLGKTLIDNDNLILIAGDSIFSLSLPELLLNWKRKCGDCVSCILLCRIRGGYIILGECSILKVNQSGEILWEFTGRDIFVTPDGSDIFEITSDYIVVKDWQNYIYKISISDGKEIK